MSTASSGDLLALTTKIVSAHVSHNSISSDALVDIISTVHRALLGLGQAPDVVAERPMPAVPIRKSVFPDYIICLEDGRKLKMLKRHLKSAYGLTTEQYRERWNLPADYPMVAPSYARHRSTLAKRIGLGTRPASQH